MAEVRDLVLHILCYGSLTTAHNLYIKGRGGNFILMHFTYTICIIPYQVRRKAIATQLTDTILSGLGLLLSSTVGLQRKPIKK